MARRIRFDMKMFREVRYLPGVQAEVGRVVRRVKESAGEGYEGGTEDGGDRVRGYVVTASARAMRNEAADHDLQRALAREAK